jgi:hypothetical protein
MPARVDALTLQVSQLRDEMRSEFSAVRGEIQAGDEETRRTLSRRDPGWREERCRTLREDPGGDEKSAPRSRFPATRSAGDERVMESRLESCTRTSWLAWR